VKNVLMRTQSPYPNPTFSPPPTVVHYSLFMKLISPNEDKVLVVLMPIRPKM